MLELNPVQQIALTVLPLLLAITFHELAHGWVANQLGDPTAKLAGRLSFNPIRHMDFWGTLVVPIVILVLTQFKFVFGWAKPVPIGWSNFSNPRRDIALVALAGPVSNFLMALLWVGLLAHLDSGYLSYTAQVGVLINVILMVLNLLPLPPLDGSRVVTALLPHAWGRRYAKIERFGLLILVVLAVSGVLHKIIIPPTIFVIEWLYTLVGL